MQNTYHSQTAKLIATVCQAMPEMSGEVMQEWIENPKALRHFLKGLCPPKVAGGSSISIDRSVPFDPKKFLNKGWIIDEQDERSLALAKVDLLQVRLVSMIKNGEESIQGEEKLKRLKATGNIRLDAGVFQALWENQELIPAEWEEKTKEYTTYVFFDGTIIRDPYGRRYVLCLYFGDGRWDWNYFWLGHHWCANYPSAVLASQP